MNGEDKEVYKLIGEVLGRLDGISNQLGDSTQRMNRLEDDIVKNRDDLSVLKQAMARQTVLYCLAMGVVVTLINTGLHNYTN